MTEQLRIALVQADTRFDSTEGNLAHLEELIDGQEADLFLLPELFNTGYQAAFSRKAETMGLQTSRWMLTLAKRKNAAICGSIAIAEKGLVYNRFLLAEPDGAFQHYDKVNVFAYSGEDKVFTAGQIPGRFSFRGWNIKPIVCFDLRFPEAVRNSAPYYDLILCPAHWPSPRIQAWDRLLRARAIENQAFLAACNRVGNEGSAEYPGHSVVLDFLGSEISNPMGQEGVFVSEISKTQLLEFRNQFPFLKERP
jgi:predicted amidohydrolase